MPRDLIPARTDPKPEIAHEVEKHNRPYKEFTTAPEPLPRHDREYLYKKDFRHAVDRLAVLNSASAVEFMQNLPQGLLEMFLLAEEVGQGRPMILGAFPKPGTLARSRYIPDAVSA